MSDTTLGRFPTSKLILEDDFLKPKREDDRSRLVILDVPNILYLITGPERFDNQTNPSASVMSLLIVMRYFFKNKVDVAGFVPRKYTLENVLGIMQAKIIQELIKEEWLTRLEPQQFDDNMYLELAYNSTGVVLSKDQFRDAVRKNPRYLHVIDKQTVRFDNPPIINDDDKFCFTANGHFVADYLIKFWRQTAPYDLHKLFYSNLDDPEYELVIEQRDRRDDEYFKERVDKIDVYLAKIMNALHTPSPPPTP